MLITISGPSTVGKDSTWLAVAESLGLEKVIPHTSRSQRENEANGENHHYITKTEFQKKIKNNEFLEWDYILGNYYGTSQYYREKIPGSEKLVVDILAKMAIRIKYKLDNVVTVLLLTSDQSTLEERLLARGYSGEELFQRTNHGRDEEAHAMLFDHVIPDADILTKQQVAAILTNIIERID